MVPVLVIHNGDTNYQCASRNYPNKMSKKIYLGLRKITHKFLKKVKNPYKYLETPE